MLDRDARVNRHLKSNRQTLKKGLPSNSEGSNGDITIREVSGATKQYVKNNGKWNSISGETPAVAKTIVVTGSSGVSSAGGGASGSDHSGLDNLSSDDHAQYLHNTIARTVSANHAFTGTPSFTGIDINGGTINGITDLAVGDGGTGQSTLDNLITLGNHTVGNYMSNVTGNSQVSVSHTQAEGSTAGLSITNDSIGDTQLAYNTGQHLTTSSAVTFSTVNTGQGANELYDMNQNVLTSSDVTFNDIVVAGDDIRSDPFSSGFTGSGWKIDNAAALEVESATIRGTLSVYELLIQQIRATNGAIFVSSAAKVESANSLSADSDNGTITFEDPSDNNICPFAANDLIMMQRINPGALVAKNAAGDATDVIKKLVYKVHSVSGKIATVVNGGFDNKNFPVAGDDFVRIGNTTNDARDGVIYLTSDDSEAPYIDIKADINSYSDWTGDAPKVRLGKLDGITDTDAGLDGSQSELYGLYSDTVRLKGHIHATTGSISNSVTIGGTAASTVKDGAASGASAQQNGSAKTGGSVGGWTISGGAIVGSTEAGGSEITMESNGNIYTDHWSINRDGSASFADNNITFATNGDITSNTFLIERTRLFGAGEDGTCILYAGTVESTYEGGNGTNQVNSQHGESIITRSGNTWSMQGDCYFDTLTISNSGGALRLDTNGFRLFVKNTFTIASGCYVSCNGSQPSGYDDGDAHGGGSANGTLSRGAQGHAGGAVGIGSSTNGGRGGAAGGGGGIVFIAARLISNSGYIEAKGGNGHAGQQGGSD